MSTCSPGSSAAERVRLFVGMNNDILCMWKARVVCSLQVDGRKGP
jgi:hypothetical protein